MALSELAEARTMIRLHKDDERDLAVELARLVCVDPKGRPRRQSDPLFELVTEGRQSPKYSSCGDLGHWLLFRLGYRYPWINRTEHHGWKIGQNLSALCSKSEGGANPFAVSVRLGMRILPGDVLVTNAHHPPRSHVMVCLSECVLLSGARFDSADYGQFDQEHGKACGRVVRDHVVSIIGAKVTIGAGASIVSSVLALDSLETTEPAEMAHDIISAAVYRQRYLRLTDPRMHGPDVQWCCETLRDDFGRNCGVPMNVFGRMADSAVVFVEHQYQMAPLGNVGPAVWRVLLTQPPIP